MPTNALIPDPGGVVKIGEKLIGTFLIGSGTPADVWADAALGLATDNPDLLLGTTIRLDVTDAVLELRPDFTTVSLGVTLVPVDNALALVTSTADVHLDVVLVSAAMALLLDGGVARVNPQLHPSVCTDLDLVAVVCTDLDLATSTAQVLALAPLDCVEA